MKEENQKKVPARDLTFSSPLLPSSPLPLPPFQAQGSFTPVLINHQLIGTPVQCPHTIPTCIIHQYVTVSMPNRPSNSAI